MIFPEKNLINSHPVSVVGAGGGKKGSQSWKEDGWISPLTATTQIPGFQIVPAMILLSSWRIWLFRGAHSVGAASSHDLPAARGKVGALSSMKHLSGCLSLFYSVAMH